MKMNKIWIIKIAGIVLLLVMGFLSFKFHHFVIMNRAYDAIKRFREEENRYYFVMTMHNDKLLYEEYIFAKDNQIKYLKFLKNLKQLYFEYRNFNTDEKYAWAIKENNEKIVNEEEQSILSKKFITKIPTIVSQLYENDKLNISKLFDIQYIASTEYEDRKCYKIKTKAETVLLDKETYLPVYVRKDLINSDGQSFSSVEYIYEFQTGTVTEQDMEIP